MCSESILSTAVLDKAAASASLNINPAAFLQGSQCPFSKIYALA
jgi:hypothetical protein